MTETLFEIVSINKPIYLSSYPPSTNPYPTLLHNFCTTSYGLYTELFIKQITKNAQLSHPHLHKFLLKKHLRKCVKKFMFTDLQLIFLDYYCTANQWNLSHPLFFKQFQNQHNLSPQQSQQKSLQFFLSMNAYFVKSYLGDPQQFTSIQIQLNTQSPNFTSIYQQWILSLSKQIFTVSPKKINHLYKIYSQFCQQQTIKKDYNDLVDTLIQLSTSYSMIPNKQKQINKNKHISSNKSSIPNKCNKYNKNKNKEIYKIQQKQQNLQHSSLSSQIFQPNKSKSKNKSSYLFDHYQSSNQQILTNNRKKQQSYIDLQYSRSRQKPPNKISLTIKRKQKPNQTVLGYIKQPFPLQLPDSQPRLQTRSILNQSYLQNNISFINLRSSRSSKNNSNLPFLWRPSQDNFFDQTKLN